jgi:ubiquinone biosynthesis protein Coq4
VRLIGEALWRGFRAGSFVAADWEALLEMPLEEVRRRLRVYGPPTYTPLFTEAVAAMR